MQRFQKIPEFIFRCFVTMNDQSFPAVGYFVGIGEMMLHHKSFVQPLGRKHQKGIADFLQHDTINRYYLNFLLIEIALPLHGIVFFQPRQYMFVQFTQIMKIIFRRIFDESFQGLEFFPTQDEILIATEQEKSKALKFV